MADKTGIEWTDATWNPIAGCSILSKGCANCYAQRQAARLAAMGQRKYQRLTKNVKGKPVWTGEIAVAADEPFTQPLRWTRGRKIFVNSMSDLFHENVPDETIDRVFAVMALTPRHTYQVLTKRAARMREWFLERWQGTPAQRFMLAGKPLDIPAGAPTGRSHQVAEACEEFLGLAGLADPDKDHLWTADGKCKAMQWAWPLPNVWLGVSVEDQATADDRIPLLFDTPAAVRWISAEPLLGPIDLNELTVARDGGHEQWNALDRVEAADAEPGSPATSLDWVVAGGESGPEARPMHPDWIRELRDQCASVGVPFFFKQWGRWAPDLRQEDPRSQYVSRHPGTVPNTCADVALMAPVSKLMAGKTLDGVEHCEFPLTA